MHFYTSVNNNYLAKARTLAKSVKEHCSDAIFTLMLYDKPLEGFDLKQEPFDAIMTMEDLELPVYNLKEWIYMHNVVELGTAVKGQAALKLLEKSDKVVYLDPDIVVFQDLDELSRLLDQYCCVVTPHQLAPDRDEIAIVGNEIGSMLRGTYNFGFYAFNNSETGIKAATWFRDRLLDFCYDEVENGFFTDQRWGNLIPAMFEDVCIWRNPGANVCSWNVTNRKVTRDESGKLFSNGQPLLFYHFSGFDSGAQLEMVKLFDAGNDVLVDMCHTYRKMIDANGQSELGKLSYQYNYYSDGTKVQDCERKYFRHNPELIEKYKDTDPFDVSRSGYRDWYRDNIAARKSYEQLEQELAAVYNSRSWKITKPLRAIKRTLRG